jgi:hypothetical protein
MIVIRVYGLVKPSKLLLMALVYLKKYSRGRAIDLRLISGTIIPASVWTGIKMTNSGRSDKSTPGRTPGTQLLKVTHRTPE